jgi:hypothetical protein
VRAVDANSTEEILPIAADWNRLFPLPASEEGESGPGETGTPESSPEPAEGEGGTGKEGSESGPPSAPSDGTGMPKGTLPDEVTDSEEETKREKLRLDSLSDAEKMKDPKTVMRPRGGKIEAIGSAGKAGWEPVIDNRGLKATENVRAFYPENHRNVSKPVDAGAVAILKTAFRGTGGKRFRSDVTDSVDVDRYISRVPEMFVDKRGDTGRKADIILIIDGSGSMNDPWRQYGYAITTALISLRDSGHVSRLRIVVSSPSSCLMLTHPVLTDAMRISPNASYEGLWIAYESIVKQRWISEPQNTTLLVLTDGNITDNKPSKRLMHAAGVYPIGIYVGEPEHANEATGDYFDRFLVRPSLRSLLAEMSRTIA